MVSYSRSLYSIEPGNPSHQETSPSVFDPFSQVPNTLRCRCTSSNGRPPWPHGSLTPHIEKLALGGMHEGAPRSECATAHTSRTPRPSAQGGCPKGRVRVAAALTLR